MLPRHPIADADRDRVQGLRPAHGPAADSRRLLDAALRIARTGAPRRDLPDRSGNWNSARRRFDRWARAGVRQKVFDALQGPGTGRRLVDSTVIRAHPCAAGAGKRRAGPGATPASTGWGCRPGSP